MANAQVIISETSEYLNKDMLVYGVGNSIIYNYNTGDVIAMSKLQDLSIDFSGGANGLKGGDSPYSFAYFPKDNEIKVSATNAIFDLNAVALSQGSEIVSETSIFTEIETHIIEAYQITNKGLFGKITLKNTPIVDSEAIDDYEKIDFENISSIQKNQYAKDDTLPHILYFKSSDISKTITVIYERNSSVNTKILSGYVNSMPKYIKFVHRINIYNKYNEKIATAQLCIFKCKMNNNFTLGLKPSTVFYPKIEFIGIDPQRSDNKTWDWSIEYSSDSSSDSSSDIQYTSDNKLLDKNGNVLLDKNNYILRSDGQ